MNVTIGQYGRLWGILWLTLLGLSETVPAHANDCIENLSVRPKGAVQLVWNHTASALSYDILRGPSLQSIDTLLANTTSTYSTWLDQAVAPGETYYYQIRRIDAQGECLSDPIASFVPANRRDARARVPDVVGDDEAVAIGVLEGVTLVVGQSSAVPDATAVPGSVLVQDPPARSVVAAGSSVSLVIAETPPPEIEQLDIVIDDTSTVSAVFGSDGGSLSISDVSGFDYELVVPAFAVNKPTEFSISNVLSIGNLPDEIEPVAAVVLGPSGVEFPIAVELKIAIPEAVRDGRAISALKSRDDGTGLALNSLIGSSIEGAAFTDLEVTVPLTSFSVVSLAKIFADLNSFVELINQLLLNLLIGQRPYETEIMREMIAQLKHIENKQMLGLETNESDFQVVLDLHDDWLNGDPINNPDGWRTFVTNLDDEQLLDLDLLKQLFGERLRIVEIGQMIGVESGRLEAAIDEMLALVIRYLNANKNRCDDNTLAAQDQYKRIAKFVQSKSAISPNFLDLANRLIEGDRAYECSFELTMTPKQGFLVPGEISIVDFTATLQDGSTYDDSAPGLFGKIGADRFEEALFTFARLDVTNAAFGAQRPLQFEVEPNPDVSEVTVTATTGLGSPVQASIIEVPDMLGAYQATGSGFAECASDPEDSGPGNVGETLVFNNTLVQVLDDPLGKARITIESAGTVVTSLVFSADIARQGDDSIDVTGIFGSANYFYQEEDEDEDGNPVTIVVSGGGAFTGGSGTISETQTTFELDFTGADNFCELVKGKITLLKL